MVVLGALRCGSRTAVEVELLLADRRGGRLRAAGVFGVHGAGLRPLGRRGLRRHRRPGTGSRRGRSGSRRGDRSRMRGVFRAAQAEGGEALEQRTAA